VKLYIGSKRYSTWSLRPWLFLTCCNVPFTEELIPFEMQPGRRECTERIKQRFRDVSPNARVPVLHTDDGLRINESLAICEYVNEQYLAGAGWPAASGDRHFARSACLEMATGFFALRSLMPMSIGDTVAATTDPPAAVVADLNRVMEIFDRCLGNGWSGDQFLLGEFGILDAYYAPILFRFETYRIPMSPRLQSYWRRLNETPGLRQWRRDAQLEEERIPDITMIIDSYPQAHPGAGKV